MCFYLTVLFNNVNCPIIIKLYCTAPPKQNIVETGAILNQ